MSANVAPPSMDACHWTVGGGVPEAAAVKLNGRPAVTVWSDGFVVTTGATAADDTERVAAVVVAELTELVKTARYWLPLSLREPVTLRLLDVAPSMSEKLLPPSVDTCH